MKKLTASRIEEIKETVFWKDEPGYDPIAREIILGIEEHHEISEDEYNQIVEDARAVFGEKWNQNIDITCNTRLKSTNKYTFFIEVKNCFKQKDELKAIGCSFDGFSKKWRIQYTAENLKKIAEIMK